MHLFFWVRYLIIVNLLQEKIGKLVIAMSGSFHTKASSDVSFVIVKNVMAGKYKVLCLFSSFLELYARVWYNFVKDGTFWHVGILKMHTCIIVDIVFSC